MNLNPFKKKDDMDFKLNDTQLPSLSESSGDLPKSEGISEPNSSTPELPRLPSLGGSNNSVPNLSSPPKMASLTEAEDNGELVGVAPNPIKSWENPDMTPQNEPSGSSGDHHKALSNSKLDTIEAKVTLIDARMMAMEQKIELIFQMISNEVSDETKRKYKVESMMKNFKK